MAPVNRPLLSIVVVASALAVGCKAKPLEVKSTATVVVEGGREKIRVEVQTEPNVDVYASGGGTDTPPSALGGPSTPGLARPLPPAGGYAGSSYSNKVRTDASGKATLIIPIWNENVLEKNLYVYADGMKPGSMGKSKYRYGSSTVLARRQPLVRYATATREVSCVGRACSGTLNASTFRLDFRDIEPETTVDFGGQKARTTTRLLSVSTELSPYYNKVKLEDVFKEYPLSNFDIPLELEFSDGSKLATKMNFSANALKYPLGTYLASAATAPVLFEGEAPGGASEDNAVFVTGYKPRIFGRAELARDVDLVAVLAENRTFRYCDGLKQWFTDAAVTVFERRTAKKRATQSFTAIRPRCNENDSTSSASANYDERAMELWLKGLLK